MRNVMPWNPCKSVSCNSRAMRSLSSARNTVVTSATILYVNSRSASTANPND
jgi:hypothetical protein